MYETNRNTTFNIQPSITLQERLAVAKAYRDAKAILDACPKIGYSLNTWGQSPRVKDLKSIEMYILEAALAFPELLGTLKGSHRKSFRQSMEDHFGHAIPDSYFSNPLSKGYKDNLTKLVEQQGIKLKRADYRTLKDILLALKPKLLSSTLGQV